MTVTALTLTSHLSSVLPQPGRSALRESVIPSLLKAISAIATALSEAQHVSLSGTANSFGDDQLNVDVIAEDLIRAALEHCPSVKTASSEEDPVEKPVKHSQPSDTQEQYTVAFDPLDGSSIIAPNWTVGTIIGIWDNGASALSLSPSQKQIAAILGVFGPRTTAVVALRVPGSEAICFEVGLGTAATGGHEYYSEVIRPRIHFSSDPNPKTRYFAPANLRAAAEDERYMALVSKYISKKYTLRYSGGLVPDVVHALVKGHGVYLSPVTGQSKAKLRRLYELCPLALVVECAGGRAIDPATGRDVLETEVRNCDERGGLICGTKEEVEIARGVLIG